jgi:hypothetical protein
MVALNARENVASSIGQANIAFNPVVSANKKERITKHAICGIPVFKTLG